MTDHSALIERLEAAKRSTMLGGETCFVPVPLVDEVAAALRDLTEWRDIATAPRDEVIILVGLLDPHPTERDLHVGLDKTRRVTGYWDSIDDAWCPVGSTWEGPWFIPTHWLPLPSAPNQAKEAGE